MSEPLTAPPLRTVDLIPVWSLLPAASRPAFRAAVGADEPTWERARGWALSIALIALPYYRLTNPGLSDVARHIIREVLAEHGYHDTVRG